MPDPDTPHRLPLRAYRDLLGRYLAPQRGRVALMAVLLLAGIALRLANPRIIGYFLDTAQACESLGLKRGSVRVSLLYGGSQGAGCNSATLRQLGHHFRSQSLLWYNRSQRGV